MKVDVCIQEIISGNKCANFYEESAQHFSHFSIPYFLWFREILGKKCISSYISDYHLTIQNYSWEEMEWEIKGNVLFGSHHLEEVCNR